ncbi:hypothetical protein F5884DRAFT_858783 [Xylogone sp. PMI_703]|nr:hypothetical protein F5884DRAFT_858783 [Xylogone sp. PMI_703]
MPTWVITGAARGIGYEFVRTLAQDRANLVIALVLGKIEVEKKLVNHGVEGVHVIEADVTDRQALLKAADLSDGITQGKGVDFFISNAGLIAKPTSFRTLEDYYNLLPEFDQDLTECWNINVIGSINAIAAFIPLIKKGTGKKVIALSSAMGDIDFTNELDMDMAVPYSISKAALNMAISKFSASYRKDRILFMSISPGAVDSEDDGRGTYAHVVDVDGPLSQSLYPVRPWHKEVSEAELEKRREQGIKFQRYEPSYSRPQNTQETVKYILDLLPQKSIEKGDNGVFISHLGNKKWL